MVLDKYMNCTTGKATGTGTGHTTDINYIINYSTIKIIFWYYLLAPVANLYNIALLILGEICACAIWVTLLPNALPDKFV